MHKRADIKTMFVQTIVNHTKGKIVSNVRKLSGPPGKKALTKEDIAKGLQQNEKYVNFMNRVNSGK